MVFLIVSYGYYTITTMEDEPHEPRVPNVATMIGCVNTIVNAVGEFRDEFTHLPNVPVFDAGNAILQQLAAINQTMGVQTATLQRIEQRMDAFSDRLDAMYV